MVLILTSDFKVEEMSFCSVETSTPTRPGRDEVEIQVVILILLCYKFDFGFLPVIRSFVPLASLMPVVSFADDANNKEELHGYDPWQKEGFPYGKEGLSKSFHNSRK